MKALKIIVIIVVAFFAIFLVLGIVAPKEYSVERSVEINAPREVVYAQVSNLKKMDTWSPWSRRDSNIIQTYEGTDGEVGSIAKWEGNEEVGKGMQEITSLEENKRVETKLTFLEPWESESMAYVELEDGENGTVKVSWGFTGENAFPMNAMMLFMDMDAAIGKDFEEGLNNLKQMAEAEAAEREKAYMGYKIQETEVPMKSFVVVRKTVKWDGIKDFFATNLGKVYQATGTAGYEITGAPVGLYYTWDAENQQTDMAAGIPVEQGTQVNGFETVDAGGKAVYVAYYGPYEKMENVHNALGAYLEHHDYEMSGPVMEEYMTDPGQEPDTSKWLTNVYYFVK